MTTYKFTLTSTLPFAKLASAVSRYGHIENMSWQGEGAPVKAKKEKAPKQPFDLRAAAEKGRRVTAQRRAEHLNTFREIVAPYLQVVPRASGKEIADYLLKKGFRTVRGNRFTASSVIHALHSSGLWTKGAQRRNTWDRGSTNGLEPQDEAMVSMLPPWND